MRIQGDGWKVPGVHGIPERYRGQPRQGTSNNGDNAANKYQRSTKPQQQSSCTKQVRLKSNRQMPTFLSHIEEVLQVDGRMLAGIRRPEVIPVFPTIVESLQTKGRTVSLPSRLLGSLQCSLGQRRG